MRFIAMHRRCRAGTLLRRVVVVATRAGVHRCHKREVRWVVNRIAHTRDGDMLILHRLAQHLQHRVTKLGHLIEEEDAVDCEECYDAE